MFHCRTWQAELNGWLINYTSASYLLCRRKTRCCKFRVHCSPPVHRCTRWRLARQSSRHASTLQYCWYLCSSYRERHSDTSAVAQLSCQTRTKSRRSPAISARTHNRSDFRWASRWTKTVIRTANLITSVLRLSDWLNESLQVQDTRENFINLVTSETKCPKLPKFSFWKFLCRWREWCTCNAIDRKQSVSETS